MLVKKEVPSFMLVVCDDHKSMLLPLSNFSMQLALAAPFSTTTQLIQHIFCKSHVGTTRYSNSTYIHTGGPVRILQVAVLLGSDVCTGGGMEKSLVRERMAAHGGRRFGCGENGLCWVTWPRQRASLAINAGREQEVLDHQQITLISYYVKHQHQHQHQQRVT